MAKEGDSNTAHIADAAIIIQKPPETVWRFLIDPQNNIRFRTGMSESSITTEGCVDEKLCEGAKLTITDKDDHKVIVSVVKFESPNIISFKHEEGPWKGCIETLKLNTKSRVVGETPVLDSNVSISFNVCGSFLYCAMNQLRMIRNLTMSHQFMKDLKKLKEIIESN